MSRPKPNKEVLLAGLATHVLAHGLNTASLRPMAASVGTSDRMLIYHFGNKDALMAALLEYLAQEMAAGLDAVLPERRYDSEAALVAAIVTLMRTSEVRPYMRVWFDIVSATGGGQTQPPEIGKKILSIYLEWIARRHPAGDVGAPRALALVEGLLVIEAVGHSGLVDQVLGTLEV